MGFALKNNSQKPEISHEKLTNVEKFDSSQKVEPVVEPINTDIDKSDLGKKPDEGQNSRTNLHAVGTVPTLRNKQGAGINNVTNQLRSHDVVVEDHSLNTHKKYNFKVSCITCGWEGRYEHKERADGVAKRHKDAHTAIAA